MPVRDGKNPVSLAEIPFSVTCRVGKQKRSAQNGEEQEVEDLTNKIG